MDLSRHASFLAARAGNTHQAQHQGFGSSTIELPTGTVWHECTSPPSPSARQCCLRELLMRNVTACRSPPQWTRSRGAMSIHQEDSRWGGPRGPIGGGKCGAIPASCTRRLQQDSGLQAACRGLGSDAAGCVSGGKAFSRVPMLSTMEAWGRLAGYWLPGSAIGQVDWVPAHGRDQGDTHWVIIRGSCCCKRLAVRSGRGWKMRERLGSGTIRSNAGTFAARRPSQR